ncbi:hypothetical protein Q8A67_015775 [Cirrhinus molitorella]|uniref:Uncharacterized protein n=1 Tax=Cirrhinus molitorella TaxID=172907 RepID=A0AA88PIE7_9TELE|nr:hypothetical protein Q8A67_015775 [Cirrhinus molitorella]
MWEVATEHLTFWWKPLLPETPVAAEIEQRPVSSRRIVKRGEPHPSLYEGVLGSPYCLSAPHASKEPDLVGTGWPTVPTLGHGGEETSQTLPHIIIENARKILQRVSNSDEIEKGSRKKATLGIFGKSGEGKSSLLNANLGKKELLPSGCFGACTAVVTQVEANLNDSNYTAETEFFSKEEWEKELKDLFRYINDDSEGRNEDLVDIAVENITALYGDDADKKTLEKLQNDEKFAEIKTALSNSTKKISESNLSEFSNNVASFIQHKIPNLQDDLRNLNKSINRELARDYVNKAKGHLSLIQSGQLDKDKNMIEMKVNEFKKNLENSLIEVDKYFDSIYNDLEQHLSNGVEESVNSCVDSTKKLIASNINERGFHKILAALCKNYRCYWSKNWDVILDLNKTLAKHLHKSIYDDFCKIFPMTGTTGKSVQEQIDKFSIIQNDSAYPSSDILHHIHNFIKTEEIKLKAALNRDIVEKKKEIYSSIQITIVKEMASCYRG